MSFCSRLVPNRIEEQAVSALVEVFLQTKSTTIPGIDLVRYGIGLIISRGDPIRYEIFYYILLENL